jgi:predicted RNase H-like HicB family nuclease
MDRDFFVDKLISLGKMYLERRVMTHKFSVLITKERNWYVARCPELDVTSQGKTIEKAKENLREAVELYVESFGLEDIPKTKSEPIWTTMEIKV